MTATNCCTSISCCWMPQSTAPRTARCCRCCVTTLEWSVPTSRTGGFCTMITPIHTQQQRLSSSSSWNLLSPETSSIQLRFGPMRFLAVPTFKSYVVSLPNLLGARNGHSHCVASDSGSWILENPVGEMAGADVALYRPWWPIFGGRARTHRFQCDRWWWRQPGRQCEWQRHVTQSPILLIGFMFQINNFGL